MVLTEPGLSVIVDAMLIARGVFQRMLSFLTYRVSATLQLVFFFFIGVFALPPVEYGVVDPEHPDQAKFFHLPVLMFMLITLLNDGTLMAIGYDRVFPQPRPQRWNLRMLFFIAAILAGVACVSSLMLLWMALDSWKNYESSWFNAMGLPKTDYPHLITMIYLKISISDFLTLFAARTQDKPFFAYRPSGILLGGAGFSLSLSTCVASFWPESSPDDIKSIGLAMDTAGVPPSTAQHLMPLFVWAYCLLWWFIQDAVKVGAYWVVTKYDIFSYRTFMNPDARMAGIIDEGTRLAAAADTDDKAAPMLKKSVN
jgi:H+-transporting ATPase